MSSEDGSHKSMDDVLSSIRKIMRGGSAKLGDVPAPGSLVEGGSDPATQADEWAMPPGALADPEPIATTPEADDGTFGLGGNAVAGPGDENPDPDSANPDSADDVLELGAASVAGPDAADSDDNAAGSATDTPDDDDDALVLGPAMQTVAGDAPGPAADSEIVTAEMPEEETPEEDAPEDLDEDPSEALSSYPDLPPAPDEVSDDEPAEDALDPFAALRAPDDGDDATEAAPEIGPEDDPEEDDYIPPPPAGVRLGGLSVVSGGFNLGVRSMLDPESEPEPQADLATGDSPTDGAADLYLPDLDEPGSDQLTDDMFEDEEPEGLPAAPNPTELEDAIRTIVRDELAGEFGDRLSSVIRRLIQEEVARALSSRH